MKINKEEYLLHISGERETKAMKRVLDLIDITLNRHIITYTDFLEPDLINLAISILNRFEGLKYEIDGGFSNAERKTISIYSWYYLYDRKNDSNISAIEIFGNISNLEHRDVLGSILGLGIVREKIGDIAFFEDSVQVVVSKDIIDYILFNLNKIRRENVKLKILELEELGEIIEKGIEKNVIASSMRVDAIISEAFNLSRSDSQKLISSGLVKVNFSTEEKGHKNLEEDDLISVRGKGRVRIKSIDGYTKRERIKLKLFYPE